MVLLKFIAYIPTLVGVVWEVVCYIWCYIICQTPTSYPGGAIFHVISLIYVIIA